MSTCVGCGREMAAAARFCGVCGTPTRRHRRAVAARGRDAEHATARAALAFGIACAATFAGLISSSSWLDHESSWSAVWLGVVAVGGAGAAASLALGERRGIAPLRTRPAWLLLAVPAAALTLAIAFGYVWLLPGEREVGEPASLPTWVAAVLVAPLLEEWLCRGVAWRAGTVMANERAALVLTSVLFAFLHGLGGHLLAVPHRLVGGFVYGFLRWRSGSLLPGVLAHALHNVVAVAWSGG